LSPAAHPETQTTESVRSSKRQHISTCARLQFHHDAFEGLILLDSQGHERIYLSRHQVITPAELGDRSQASEFVVPMTSGESYYGPVRFEAATGEPMMTMAVPLFDPRRGLVDGVLVAEARIKPVWNLIASIPVSEEESVYVVDAQGRVIAHRNPSIILRGTRFTVPDQDGIHPGLDGTNVMLTTDNMWLGAQEFVVVVERSILQALSLAFITVGITAILIVLTLMAAGSSSLLIVRRIVRPIETLAAVARAITAGDLSRQAGGTRRDEIGTLATAFDAMTARLRDSISELEQEIAEREQAEELLRKINRAYQALSDCNQALIRATDEVELLQDVCRIIVEDCAYIGVNLRQRPQTSEVFGSVSDGESTTG